MTDDLTNTVFSALQTLDATRKANFLLDTALALIDAGKYGDEVEKYLDVYLKTPNLPKTSIAKALLARANARKFCGERLLAQAHQDFQAVLRLDPSNRDVQNHLRRRTIRFSHDPPSHRAPTEVWSRIATYIPRYHLRTWLFLSSFHRDIAVRHIFHTIDLYFGEDQPENVNRSLDIFDRVKVDKLFASRVKCLRVHWAYEEGELLDLMTRVFKTALPEFIALREFEWIGYPELRADMVQSVLSAHPNLQSLGLIGFHFDACGISSFTSLRKLTLRAEDDDGYADMSEITTVLNNNYDTLTHLILGAYLHRQHSWDPTFLSPTIHNLTHLDLVDTRISHAVLSRIAHAAGGVGGRLESLTLHGILEEPGKAAVVFGSDEVINGEHTFLPRLKSFRFLLVGQPQVITPPPVAPPQVQPPPFYNPHHPSSSAHPLYAQQQQQQQQQNLPPHPQEHYDPDILQLYQTITHFLRGRTKLRKLDLGNCPWELVTPLLPGLTGLRVLGVRIGCASRLCPISALSAGKFLTTPAPGTEEMSSEVEVLVKSLPEGVEALRVDVGVSEQPLHLYSNLFTRFSSLSFLHLHLHNAQPAHQHPLHPQYAQLQQPHHPHSLILPHHPHPHPQYPVHQPQQHQMLASGSTSGSSSFPQGQGQIQGQAQLQGGQGPGTPKRRLNKRDGVDHEGEAEGGEDGEVSGAGTGFATGASVTSATTGPTGAPLAGHSPTRSAAHQAHQAVLHHPRPMQPVHVPPLPPPQLAPAQPLDNLGSAKYVAAIVPSLDFVGWDGELYAIVRGGNSMGNGGVGLGANAIVGPGADATLTGKDVRGPSLSRVSASASPLVHTENVPGPSPTISNPNPTTHTNTNTPNAGANSAAAAASSTTPTGNPNGNGDSNVNTVANILPASTIELKELPSRRRLDCGKGVDLGSDDAVWLERKDVPMDYDMPVVPEGTV